MPGRPRRKCKSREDIRRFRIAFRVLMTKPAKIPVFLSEYIFASSLRLRILFSQFETLEKNACEYLWKEYDRELSPLTSIGSHPSDTRKRFPRFTRPVQDDPLTYKSGIPPRCWTISCSQGTNLSPIIASRYSGKRTGFQKWLGWCGSEELENGSL